MNKNMRNLKKIIFVASVLLTAASCHTPKDITYFQNLQAGGQVNVAPTRAITAEPGDRISIVVHSKDPQLAELFNLPIQARRTGNITGSTSKATTSSSSNQTSSYVVDSFGDIEFPFLGTLHVGELTRQEIQTLIKDELIRKNLIKDPTVVVEFLDHSFTILGAVGSPGRIVFDRDQLTLVEAIGLAGDLQLDGKRQNVKVYRMEEGKQRAYEVDLTDANSVYSSPVYYIQPNDYIYVEQNDKAKRTTTANGNSPFTPSFWISLVSFATTIAVLVVNL